jgi:hypothetical protein
LLHRTSVRLIIVGAGVLLLLVAAGIVTVSAKPPSQAGEPPNLGAAYVGTGFCKMCHTEYDTWHASDHASMVRPASADTILGDLSDTAAITITWPDGSQRPLTAEDITYVLGGRYMQQYVSVMDRPDGTTGYYVLPVQWNIPQTSDQQGTWTPSHADDWTDPAQDWRVACAGCHTTGLDGATAADQTNFAFADNWKSGQVELNIGCEACHGPGGNHRANKGTIVQSPDAQICGQCHIQGHDPSGEHAYPVGYQPGLALDTSVFIPAPQTDESVWWPDGHARVYDQYGEWSASAHAQTRVMGEICVRCHGTAPDTEGWTLDDVIDGITCAACHDAHSSGLRIPETALQTPSAATAPPAQPQVSTPTPGGFSYGEAGASATPTELPAPTATTGATATPTTSSSGFSYGATATPTTGGFSYGEAGASATPTELPAPTAPTAAAEPSETPTQTPVPTTSVFSWGGTATPVPTESSGFSWGSQSAPGKGAGLQRMVTIPAASRPFIELVLRQEMPLDYTLCVSCHNSHTPQGEPMVLGGGLHHPTQEMFEGWDMVDEVKGIPSAHYSAEGGPLCSTCHMPKTVQIGEFGHVSSHTMMPVLPSSEIDPDSCSVCHSTLVTRPALQQFIDNTQAGTKSRIAAIKAVQNAPDWVTTVVGLIEGDGSQGVHNPAYTDALLTAAEATVGIRPLIATEPSPQELGLQPVQAMEEAQETQTNVAESGLKMPSIILLAVCGVIIAAAAYAFFVREAGHE